MTKINWHSEALEFAKVNDSKREATVAIIEKAMKHGAFLMVGKTTDLIKSASDDLKRKHLASAPHKQQSKTIEIEQP